ncbi:DUF4190 domain-containing protein, partial [Micromonospora harpali]
SPLTVIFGHVALNQIRRDRTDGHGMAMAGVIPGWILTGPRMFVIDMIHKFGGLIQNPIDQILVLLRQHRMTVRLVDQGEYPYLRAQL